MNEEEKSTREKILTQAWTSHVKDELGLTNLVQTEAEFSYAIKVKDRTDGSTEVH